jgi:hypothetical protein
MALSPHAPTRRRALHLAAWAATLLTALVAQAQPAAPTLLMQVDGVKGTGTTNPLGAEAFGLVNFSFSTDDASIKLTKDAAERFGELKFTMPISGPAVALWQLAQEQKEIPKVSLVALDPASGAIRYRVDLEEVVVGSMSFQSLVKRDAAVGALTYQRIRIRSGEGDGATTASWDRAKNEPWK